MDWVYLDNNATTQPAAQVAAAMAEVNETLWANPSSVHRFGQMVRQRVELARLSVATLLGCRDREVVFTSGGTESNNLALRGVLEREGTKGPRDQGTRRRAVLLTTRIEHSAVREPAAWLEACGARVVYLPVDGAGYVEPEALRGALAAHVSTGDTAVVSVQWANNETGVIQPIGQLAGVVAEARQALRDGDARTTLLFHTDAVQAVGKMALNVKDAGVDMLTCAAHKFHGPKGVGALYVRSGVKVRAQNLGGPHERERRGGTENTPGIIGMGAAADLARSFVADESAVHACEARRDRFERAILDALPDTIINSADRPRIWNTTNLGFPQLEAEAILLGLSERGVCASAGAACSSGSLEPSPVLLAMGIDETIAHGSVRFSLCRYTTDEEIDAALAIIPQVVRKLKQTLPVGA